MSDRPVVRFRPHSCATRCALALGVVGWGASEAHAEEPVPVTVDYSVIDGCPSESAFWAALSSRSSRVRRATNEDVATQLLVSVIVTPQGVLGRLQLARGLRVTEPRFVEATSCDQVVQALALTAALSVEAEAEPEELSPKPPVPDPPPYTDRQLDPAPPPPPAREHERWQTSVRVGGLGAMLVDRHPSVGATLGIAFSRQRQLLATQTLGLSVSTLTTSLLAADANARFVLTEAELRGCPLTIGEQLLVRPCLAFQVGTLDAHGQNVSDPESSEDTWWATGLSVEAEYPGYGPVRFHMALSAIVPLAPQAYQLGLQPETITQTLPVSPWLSVGVAVVP